MFFQTYMSKYVHRYLVESLYETIFFSKDPKKIKKKQKDQI